MTDRAYNVLFLCTGNSARSILAESILPKDGSGRFRAFSAGSQPKGEVNPLALRTLRGWDYPAEGFRSKGSEEFAAPGAPVMDFVFTVCDSAAGEACPIWPGHPTTAHWGIEDPATVEGTGNRQAAGLQRGVPLHENPDFAVHGAAAQEPRRHGARVEAAGHRSVGRNDLACA